MRGWILALTEVNYNVRNNDKLFYESKDVSQEEECCHKEMAGLLEVNLLEVTNIKKQSQT